MSNIKKILIKFTFKIVVKAFCIPKFPLAQFGNIFRKVKGETVANFVTHNNNNNDFILNVIENLRK